MTLDQIDEWVRETRHKVMYRDEAKIDLARIPAKACRPHDGTLAMD